MKPLESPTLLDLLHLCLHLRGDNVDEYLAKTFNDRFDPDTAALEFANLDGPKFVLRDAAGVPVCAAGLTSVSPGVMECWMLCTDAWADHWIAITRHTRTIMNVALETGGIHRIQHKCLASRKQAAKWYASIGLKAEGIARALGKHGQDMAVFARVRGDPDGRRRT